MTVEISADRDYEDWLSSAHKDDAKFISAAVHDHAVYCKNDGFVPWHDLSWAQRDWKIRQYRRNSAN